MVEYPNPRFKKDQEDFLRATLMPTRIMESELRAKYAQMIKCGETFREANLKMIELSQMLYFGEFKYAADDDEIRSLADTFSNRYGRLALLPNVGLTGTLKAIKEDLNITLPKNANHPRLACPKFWRRQMRKIAFQKVEQVNRLLGYTRKKHSPYVSKLTAHRWLVKDKNNRKLLEAMEAENDFGQVYTLAELSDLGVSNPINRRNELMTRLSGFEEFARDDTENEWEAVFFTLTCPSRYHPTSNGQANPKYDGATPLEANNWLNDIWKKARTAYGKKGIKLFGFRIAEPHADGTPHWHILIWVSKTQTKTLTQVLQSYALSESPDEPGAKKHRFTAEQIDTKVGRATGYIAKYIAKNIDGYNVDFDYTAEQPSAIACVNARIWSSVWNIRQFQPLGGPSVTVYRECRAIASNIKLINKTPNEEDLAIIEAANSGDWSDYTKRMGGPICHRDRRPLKPAHFNKPKKGYYGDQLIKLVGLYSWHQAEPITYTKPEWTIRHATSGAGLAKQLIASQAPPAPTLEYCQ